MGKQTIYLLFAGFLLLAGVCWHFQEISKEKLNNHYTVRNIKQSENRLEADIEFTGKDNFYIKEHNKIQKQLKLEVIEDSDSELNIRIYDPQENYFWLPYKEPFPFTKVTKDASIPNKYDYQISSVGEHFFIKILRKSTQEVVFDTSQFNLIFSNLYIEFGTSLSSEYFFGMGERRQQFRYKPGKYSTWNIDHAWDQEKGKPHGQDYGFHPMFLRREKSGEFHVGFLRNTYANQFEYDYNSLVFKVLGGVIELKFFFSENASAEDAVKQYHNYVNGFTLHPFWAQGFHQSRWGYNSSQKLLDVRQNYDENALHVDTIWSDIDYMDKYEDFTINVQKFKIDQLKELSDLNTKEGVHWVPIIDIGVALKSESVHRGKELDVFLKSNVSEKDLVGVVWPGRVNFPDFNNPRTQQFWSEGLHNISRNYDGLDVSGIWIDMNEQSNFLEGELLNPLQYVQSFLSPEKKSRFHDLPFNPDGRMHPLYFRTVSLNAKVYSGEDAAFVPSQGNKQLYQFDYHNLNGFSEGVATYNYLKSIGKKLTFILTRSSMFGSGRYVQHWTGDNASFWKFLKDSISEIFNFQLFGIPFVGVDICGFSFNTNAELCARWMQVGALYPFSRNHNAKKPIPQEPYAFPKHPYVLESSRRSLALRYTLLKYYYSLFVKLDGKGTVFRPLFFEFPSNNRLFDVDTQFMLGSELMAIPVLQKGDKAKQETKITGYFPPEAQWFCYYEGRKIEGGNKEFTVPFDSTVPLFIKGGSLVPFQNVEGKLRSRFLDNKFKLLVALNADLQASGEMLTLNSYDDDNIIAKCMNGQNCVMKFNIVGSVAQDGTLTLDASVRGKTCNTNFDQVIITGWRIYGSKNAKGQYVVIDQDFQEPWIIGEDGLSRKFDYPVNQAIAIN